VLEERDGGAPVFPAVCMLSPVEDWAQHSNYNTTLAHILQYITISD
jgi:hypothetical protein